MIISSLITTVLFFCKNLKNTLHIKENNAHLNILIKQLVKTKVPPLTTIGQCHSKIKRSFEVVA